MINELQTKQSCVNIRAEGLEIQSWLLPATYFLCRTQLLLPQNCYKLKKCHKGERMVVRPRRGEFKHWLLGLCSIRPLITCINH